LARAVAIAVSAAIAVVAIFVVVALFLSILVIFVAGTLGTVRTLGAGPFGAVAAIASATTAATTTALALTFFTLVVALGLAFLGRFGLGLGVVFRLATGALGALSPAVAATTAAAGTTGGIAFTIAIAFFLGLDGDGFLFRSLDHGDGGIAAARARAALAARTRLVRGGSRRLLSGGGRGHFLLRRSGSGLLCLVDMLHDQGDHVVLAQFLEALKTHVFGLLHQLDPVEVFERGCGQFRHEAIPFVYGGFGLSGFDTVSVIGAQCEK
jgi:hypothetical protein